MAHRGGRAAGRRTWPRPSGAGVEADGTPGAVYLGLFAGGGEISPPPANNPHLGAAVNHGTVSRSAAAAVIRSRIGVVAAGRTTAASSSGRASSTSMRQLAPPPSVRGCAAGTAAAARASASISGLRDFPPAPDDGDATRAVQVEAIDPAGRRLTGWQCWDRDARTWSIRDMKRPSVRGSDFGSGRRVFVGRWAAAPAEVWIVEGPVDALALTDHCRRHRPDAAVLGGSGNLGVQAAGRRSCAGGRGDRGRGG